MVRMIDGSLELHVSAGSEVTARSLLQDKDGAAGQR